MAGERAPEQIDMFANAGVELFVFDGDLVRTLEPDVEPVSISVSDEGVLSAAVPVVAAIEDAGEELVANRRNRYRTARQWNDIAGLSDALKAKEATKGNIWPKPDYLALIAQGMAPFVAHLVKQVYDSVPVKPFTGRRLLDDSAIQNYIKGSNRVEAGLLDWATDPKALSHFASSNARFAGAMLGRQVTISEISTERQTLLDKVFPDGWKAFRDELQVVGGNKLLGALQPGFDEIKRAMKAVDNGWPEKREAWEVQGYRVVNGAKAQVESFGRENCFILAIGDRYVKSFDTADEAQQAADAVGAVSLFNKRGFVASFGTEEEAIAAARERTSRDKGQVVSEKGKHVEAVERQGISRRMDGEDISSERLMTEFGLKGVNFGNWMKTPAARAEAQLHLNHAFDSLHDLAEILGLPPKAMSLNGMLGLAIGAQGSGGAFAAHFVPGVNEINLTRTSGAGSLAHEWAHALDHYFAVQAGLATADIPFFTEHVSDRLTKRVTQVMDGKPTSVEVPAFGAVRPEMIGAFNKIVKAIDLRALTEDEIAAGRHTRLAQDQKSLGRWLSAVRKDFTGLEAEFDKLAERIAAGDVGDGKVAAGKTVYLSPVVVDMREMYRQKHGRVYSLENTKNVQTWIDIVQFQLSKQEADVSHVEQTTATEFAKNARALDAAKGGKAYWATKLEKFARAFDGFVSDSLAAKYSLNDYLSHTGREGETVPMGAERVVINAAFAVLKREFNVRESERGPVLFSAYGPAQVASLRADEIAAEIKRFKAQWPSMPRVTVVGNVGELPFDAPGNADGAYVNGEVFVVAGNIADIKQLQKVMAHECVLHHSIEEMLGGYGFSKLHHGLQRLKAAGDPTVSRLAEDIRRRYGALPPEIETKEIVARAGEECLDAQGNVRIGFGFMKSVFAGVTAWLRDHGLKIPFTNLELQGIMHDAGEWVKRDPVQEEVQRPALRAAQPVLHSFAGVNAETAPLDALKVAREMRVTGTDDRTIWKETGWTFGFADGKPRFEISDEKSGFKEPGVANNYANNIVPHNDLYQAYPSLKEVKILRDESQPGSHYQAGYVVLGEGTKKSTALHELQHAVQQEERFARGGSASEFVARNVTGEELNRLNREVFNLYEANPLFYADSVKATQLQMAVKEKFGSLNADPAHPLVQKWWEAIDRRDLHPQAEALFELKGEETRIAREKIVLSPHQQYLRLAGDVEARLVQARAEMVPQDRNATYPIDQMDAPIAEQTVEIRGEAPGLVCEGMHSGRVIDVVDGFVVQKAGRLGECVRHLLVRLSAPVNIGEVVEITYRGEVGQVSGRLNEIEKGGCGRE